MHIYIDNLTPYDDNGTTRYSHQLSDIIDYVREYRFQGGPEQPIRYFEMKVDKNDIDIAHPHLIDTVVEGKTRLLVNAVDGGTFIVTKLWLTNNSYDIVATGIEVTLNTATLSADDYDAIKNLRDPPSIIKALFDRWRATLNLCDSNSTYATGSDTYEDDFKLYFSSSYAGVDEETPRNVNPSPNQIGFKENMPTLVAMNMCALLDNAFIFFADRNGVNTLYYVSYDDINPLAYNPADDEKNGVVNIYPGLTSQYVNYTKFDLMMYQRLIGISSKNSEGSETIVNNQIVSMEGGEGSAYNQQSISIYGDYAGTKVMSDLMISYEYNGTFTAQRIAQHLVQRYKDPTRSITFTLSEVVNDKATGTSGWVGQIQPFSYAYKIYDSVNNITLTNTHLCENPSSQAYVDNFMLRLSTFIRYYPEMTTEYTFGVMKETTLSQELANKLTGMSGNVADLRINGESIVKNGIVSVDTVPSSVTQNPDHLITSHGIYTALKDGTVSKVGTSNVGSGTKPIYLNAGTPTASNSTEGTDTKPLKMSNGVLTPVTNDLATKSSVDNIIDGTTTVGKATDATNASTAGSCTGNSATATKLNGDNVGSSTKPVYFDNGSPVECSTPIVRGGYVSGGSSGLEIPLGRMESPSSVVVTPRYSTSSPDYPADGWTVSSPYFNGNIGQDCVKVYHGSGIIAGWYWVAIWM